jgi:two-component system sensor histidine kinase ChvG
VASILYLSQFRAGLIDARAQSLLVQAEIIAGAIAASATVRDQYAITIDPDRLLDLKPGETYGVLGRVFSRLDFPINPERVAPVLRTLISPTKTRARIYDREWQPADPRQPQPRWPRRCAALPPAVGRPPRSRAWSNAAMVAVRTWLNRGDLPLYRELGPGEWQWLCRRCGDVAPGPKALAWCASMRTRRGDRLGRGPSVALRAPSTAR